MFFSLFLVLFIVCFVAWFLGGFVFHVAGGLIHILLVIGVISLSCISRGVVRRESKQSPSTRVARSFFPLPWTALQSCHRLDRPQVVAQI